MGKSEGNLLILESLKKAGITSLAYRYWLLTVHYRTTLNFTLEAVTGAQIAYLKLINQFLSLGNKAGVVNQDYQQKFQNALTDDLNTPEAVALLWQLLKDKTLTPADQRSILLDFDQVFGLGLINLKPVKIPPEIYNLAKKREQARQKADWNQADKLRQQIESLGYLIEDSQEGPKLKLK